MQTLFDKGKVVETAIKDYYEKNKLKEQIPDIPDSPELEKMIKMAEAIIQLRSMSGVYSLGMQPGEEVPSD